MRAKKSIDSSSTAPVAVLRGHAAAVSCLQFLPRGLLASGSSDGSVNIWNLETRRPIEILSPHKGKPILSISALPMDKRIVTCGRDGNSSVFDLERSAVPLVVLPNGAYHFCNACTDRIHTDITSVFTPSSEEAAILRWDLRCPSSPVSNLMPTVVKPDQKLGTTGAVFYQSMCSKVESDPVSSSSALIVGYESGAVISFDLRQGRELCRVKETTDPVLTLDASVLSSVIVYAGPGDSLYIHKQKEVDSWQLKNKVMLSSPGVGCARFRGDCKIFATANWDNSVRIYSKKGKLLSSLMYHRSSVYAVDFGLPSDTEFRNLLASGSKDCSIALWDVLSHTYDDVVSDEQVSTKGCSFTDVT